MKYELCWRNHVLHFSDCIWLNTILDGADSTRLKFRWTRLDTEIPVEWVLPWRTGILGQEIAFQIMRRKRNTNASIRPTARRPEPPATQYRNSYALTIWSSSTRNPTAHIDAHRRRSTHRPGSFFKSSTTNHTTQNAPDPYWSAGYFWLSNQTRQIYKEWKNGWRERRRKGGREGGREGGERKYDLESRRTRSGWGQVHRSNGQPRWAATIRWQSPAQW